ncbi:unnamed protein product [Owenia fusiformis]|uniref:SLIT-ROBO Rho GTPase-activating protein 1-like n=1 Tax=Owenia fusiformis TaxID=6347 RepID=A0A8S4NRC5_OWEFU|nr:unnamed protein product [Owenia fusiformis]
MEYSRGLDKLVKNTYMRYKTEKARSGLGREHWPGTTTYTCWQNLLAIAKKVSKDHGILADLYNNNFTQRLTDIGEDVSRIYRKCRAIGEEEHNEIVKVLNELQSAMKTYHIYHNESHNAEKKLREVEAQKNKLKDTGSKKYKSFEKQVDKRRQRYHENKTKCLKARNEYLLYIDAANAAMNKYFVQDVSDLIDCMDHGFHSAIDSSLKMYLSAEDNLQKSQAACNQLMAKSISDLDQRADKQKFLEQNNAMFSLPRKFEFQPHKGDEVYQVSAQKSVQDELDTRYQQLSSRLSCLKLEVDEIWKTLETAEKTLMDMITNEDSDVTPYFTELKQPPRSPIERDKRRADRQETEDFYINKFRSYALDNNLIARLDAKHKTLQKALGDGVTSENKRPPSLPPKPKKQRRLGKTTIKGQPKLFGGSITEYTEAINQDIPPIITSCIKAINLHGMHHQGIFRVSGSVIEINDFKAAFEKGEDPLVDIEDASDINSIAGVLKLYLRELKEPLFPIQLFDQLIECSKLGDEADFLARMKELIATLSRPVFVVMRYLFAFLHHLSEYSDENMMDNFNLGVCFGPTLLPVPPDKDLVLYQNNVNDLIKNIIRLREELFPNDGGVVYEKCMTETDSDRDLDTVESMSEGGDDDGSEEEPDVIEAIGLYDFKGRTERELSFKKGDKLYVYSQVSDDWWEGCIGEREGLIPDKYVQMRHKGDSSDNKSQSSSEDIKEDRRKSTESLPAKDFSSQPGVEAIDKSASQPNISLLAKTGRHSSSPVESKRPSVSSVDSDPGLGNQNQSPAKTLTTLSNKNRQGSDRSNSDSSDATERSTEDLSYDIENALAEVMSGLQSLELQQNSDRKGKVLVQSKLKPSTPQRDSSETSIKKQEYHPKHTPDLVMDLPIAIQHQPSSPKESSNPEPESDSEARDSEARDSHPQDSVILSTAERFASNNQSTMKKGSSMPRSYTSSAMQGEPGSPLMERQVKRSLSTSATMTARDTPEKDSSDMKHMASPMTIAPRVANIKPVTMTQTQVLPLPKPFQSPPQLLPSVGAKPMVRPKPQVMRKPVASPELLMKLRANGTPSPRSTPTRDTPPPSDN